MPAGRSRRDGTFGSHGLEALAFHSRSEQLETFVHICIAWCFNALGMDHVSDQLEDVIVHFRVHFLARALARAGPCPPGRCDEQAACPTGERVRVLDDEQLLLTLLSSISCPWPSPS